MLNPAKALMMKWMNKEKYKFLVRQTTKIHGDSATNLTTFSQGVQK